jgi:adenylate cyclase
LATERVERKLAAILAADVAGYSRLMGADEEGTLARLKALRRELADPKIEEHRGRIVKTTGDGLLIEFASVVDAVRCAVEVQREMTERNADVPSGRRIEFRMGINVGDIMKDGLDIYGDGVNVAARLEALAQPGGICVSRVVRDQVRDKLAFFSRTWASSKSRTSRGRYACTVYCSAKGPTPPSQQLQCRRNLRWLYPTSRRSRCCRSRI